MKKSKIANMLMVGLLLVSSNIFADTIKPNGCKGPVLCSNSTVYGPRHGCCDLKWHVAVGLLYQQAQFHYIFGDETYQPDDYQGEPDIYNATTGEVEILQRSLRLCQAYKPGLTVELGHFMEHDQWFSKVKFDWLTATRTKLFKTEGHGYTPNSAEFTVIDEIVELDDGAEDFMFTSVNHQKSVDLYNLEFTLARGSYMSTDYAFEPFAGVKVVWFNLNTKNEWRKNKSTNTIEVTNLTSKTKSENWGMGPEFGFNGEYNVTSCLAFYSENDVALLLGNSNVRNTPTMNPGEASEKSYPIADDNDCATFFTARSILGVKLQRYCLDEKHYVAIKIGYDMRMIANIDYWSVYPNNLTLNGLNLSLVWDY